MLADFGGYRAYRAAATRQLEHLADGGRTVGVWPERTITRLIAHRWSAGSPTDWLLRASGAAKALSADRDSHLGSSRVGATTSWPRSRSAAAMWELMQPAPPVTTERSTAQA